MLTDEQIKVIAAKHVSTCSDDVRCALVEDVENAIYEALAAHSAGAQGEPQTDAARDVLAERQRQVNVEGWTQAHDDEHTGCSLTVAAACYALFAAANNSDSADAWIQEWRKTARYLWPYDKEWQKTTTPRRDLVKAGALILAEIERIDRAKGE